MVIEGVIEEIIYRNESNGYTVGRMITSDGDITIVGYAALINTEETVSLEGDLIYHNKYGEQFSFTSINTVVPTTLKGIENYLSSGLIPNIGPKTAKRIVDKFGLESLDIIQYQPERLKEVEGIGDKKLRQIMEAYDEQRELRDIMVYLQEYDISINQGIKIYKKYGNQTIRLISENPYRLSEDIYGIGFKTADTIANKMGVSIDSPFRCEAGLKYVIKECAGEGHCYVPKEEFINKASALLEVEVEIIEDGIRDLVMKNVFYAINTDDGTNIYYKPYYIAENSVARRIMEISRYEFHQLEVDADKEISLIESKEGISFGAKQIQAIRESLNKGMFIITGGPGTGKTTTINAIITICENLGLQVSLAAPTGRAAKRMTETTGREAKTIHRLLEISFMEEDSTEFFKDEDSPIEADIIIIDEASMIDILLMNSLLKAISPGTRVILVGDIDQLPSVGPGNVLKDIIYSGIIKVCMLDEIFRQAEESMIIVNAHRVNKGEAPILNVKDKDFFFISTKNSSDIVTTIRELNKDRLPSFYGVDPIKDIQVLTPMKKGDVGIHSLNKHLQESLNPKSKLKEERQVGDQLFRVGDKVMQTKNNYKMEWKIRDGGRELSKGEGVFNGDFGYISEINKEDSILKVIFDDEKEVEYDFKQLDELMLAYATTVHKAQGSEFPVVIMPIASGPPMLLTRNLFYTGITRARKLVVLVGYERNMHMMIRNNIIADRYSSLDRRLREYVQAFPS